MWHSAETGAAGRGGLRHRVLDPTAVESHWSSLLYRRCVPMEEPTSLRSKLRRKLSGHPSQAYPWCGGGASETGKGKETWLN